MGHVYLAEDMMLGRQVAIKFPQPGADSHHFRARFLREARSISLLSHSNIATIYDYGETDDGQPFIVMEFVGGPSLSDLLHHGGLTLARAVEIIENVAEALAEAHKHGVIHRDIKPSNIVLSERDVVKVLDFGLAKQLNEEIAGAYDAEAQTLLATRTQSGVVVGTPLYLSPEQALSLTVDGRSDLFALGALLYECIAGRPAFTGATVLEITVQVIHIDPPPPSQINALVTPELDRITLKLLAKKIEERYQSAEDLIEDLKAARSDLDKGSHLRTRRLAPPHGTMGASALTTLSDMLRRPRISVFTMLAALLIITVSVWAVIHFRRPKLHQPPAEAIRWYQEGTNALRDGTYYRASKMFDQALKADDGYALAHARLAEAWAELDYADKAKDEVLIANTLVPDRAALPALESLYFQAITSTVSRNFPAAIESYQQIAQQSPDSEKPYAYMDLGRAYEKSGGIDKAIESYVQATNLDNQSSAAYLRLGVLYGRQQNLAGAAASFDKADKLYQAMSNFEGVGEVLYQRGLLFNNRDKLSEARGELQKSLDLARNTGNTYQQIKALLQLSNVACTELDTPRAQAYATEAIDLARASGLENLTTGGLIDLGNAFLVRGEYGETEKYFKQALEIAQRYKGRYNEARALLSLGSLRFMQSNVDEAVSYINQALPFYQQGGYRTQTSLALTLLARANRQKGDYDSALRSFEQLKKMAEDSSDQSQVVLSQEGIASVLVRQERYPEALVAYEQTYITSKALNNPQRIGYGLRNRGDVLWRLGRYTEARDLLNESRALADRPDGGFKALLAEVYQANARLLLSERQFSEAKAEAQRAFDLSREKYPETASEAKRVIGLSQAFNGAKREAVASCQEAFEIAARSNDPWQVSRMQLALAEALLEEGEAQAALEKALQAQESFARYGQQESEWRAWLVAARASRSLSDENRTREYATRASGLLSNLEQKWGSDVYHSYLKRPDMQYANKQLSELLAGKK